MRQRQGEGIGAGTDRLGADEADAALCRGALRRGTDRGKAGRMRSPERKCLSAQFPAVSGHHAHPVRQAVPGGKSRRAAALHPAQDRRGGAGMRFFGRKLLYQDLPGDQALHPPGVPHPLLLSEGQASPGAAFARFFLRGVML